MTMPLFRKLRKAKETKATDSASASPALPSPSTSAPTSLTVSTPPARGSSTPAASKHLFPDGIKQLYPPKGTATDDAQVDICFVHGLTGGREETWRAKGHSKPWPQELLPSDIPKARILTFGYDAYVVRSGVASSNGLDNHATNLLNDLVGDRQENHATSRPLIFVAHSLGGIVCKQAISFSRSSKFDYLHDIYDSVIGIAFMGTPHRGSVIADWSSIPASALGIVKSVNTRLIDVLRVEDPLLARTHNDFLDALAERQKRGKDIHIACFHEELAIFRDIKVVKDTSAIMDGVNPLSIHANHMDMVRFASRDDTGYTRLRQQLKGWIANNLTGKSDDIDNNDFVEDPMDKVCIQDLRLTDPDDDRTRIEKKNGTFFENVHDWVFSNDAYRQWKEGNPQSRLLWIRGDPGKGKTMIMCSIIRNLKASGTPLSYFFCQATDEQLNHATAVLRGLIYILVRQQPALVSHVRKKYDHTGKRLFGDANAWEALSKIFSDIISDELLAETVVLVDGLDECTAGRSQLLDLIAEPSRVRWLVSSRNWPDIQDGLRGAERKAELRLELNPEAIARAVDDYIRRKVDQLTVKKGLEQETRDAVEQHLLANADGTFLWVALVCHALNGVLRRNVRAALTSFPQGLSALYGRMMQTIQDTDGADECRGILAIASTVYRPITLAELQVLWPSLANLGRQDLEDVVQLCGSFLTLRDDTLYFVHQSAKDYLVGEGQLEIFPNGLPSQHHAIASRSLAALSDVLRRDMYGLKHPGFAIEDVKPPYDDPLAPVAYSCLYWVDHLADSETAMRSVSLQDGNEVHRFFLDMFLYWLEALSLLRNVWTGVLAVRKLNSMISDKEQDLASFVHDSQRFISFCAHGIAMAPLQIYASALLFSPTNSKVRRQYAREEPEWVTLKSKIPADWDAWEQTLEGHGNTITSIAFSPDGQTLASGSRDHTVKVWNVMSGQCMHTLAGHGDWVRSVAFSPNGQKLASGSDDQTVKVWDMVSGRCTHTLQGHGSTARSVVSVAFSSDGQRLVSLSENGIIRIWNVLSWKCTHTFNFFPSEVILVAFLPDSQKFIWGSYNGIVKVWDMVSGRCTQNFSGRTDEIRPVAFSPDGQRLMTGSYNGTVKVWDLVSGQCTHTLHGHNDQVRSAAFSPDGQKLASSSGGAVKVWDAAGQLLRTIDHGGSTFSLAFAPDGQYLATGSANAVKIWDVATKEPAPIHDSYSGKITSIALSPDGQHLATGSEGGSVRIWSAAKGQLAQRHDGDRGEITSMAFSPDGQQLATVWEGRSIAIWDVATGERVLAHNCIERRIMSIAFSRDGRYLATSRNKRRTKIALHSMATDFDQVYKIPVTERQISSSASLFEPKSLRDLTIDEQMEIAGALPITFMRSNLSDEQVGFCYDFRLNHTWIATRSERKLLWLPSDYRPAQAITSKDVVGIGTEGGRGLLLHFAAGFVDQLDGL